MNLRNLMKNREGRGIAIAPLEKEYYGWMLPEESAWYWLY